MCGWLDAVTLGGIHTDKVINLSSPILRIPMAAMALIQTVTPNDQFQTIFQSWPYEIEFDIQLDQDTAGHARCRYYVPC